MSSRILFIIPYFGRFHPYFPLWLETCKYNETIDWLILTDDKTAYKYPANVKVKYTTFSDVVKQIQGHFDFPIFLNKPYQLCEFKVAYGEVFEDYTNGYDFWGHCDIDVIWGNLRKHLSNEILQEFSKISWRGHLTLYKNNKHINSLYRKPIEGVDFYKHAFSNTTGFPLAPDERAINYLYEGEGEKVYKHLMFADLKIRSYNFSLLHFPGDEWYKNKHQIFLWEDGDLKRLYLHNGKIFVEDYAYIHFLKRTMHLDKKFKLSNKFLIVPNKFLNYGGEITVEMIARFSSQKLYWSYLWERLKPAYFLSKIRYWKSKKEFSAKFGFVPLKSLKLSLPNYAEPTAEREPQQ